MFKISVCYFVICLSVCVSVYVAKGEITFTIINYFYITTKGKKSNLLQRHVFKAFLAILFCKITLDAHRLGPS